MRIIGFKTFSIGTFQDEEWLMSRGRFRWRREGPTPAVCMGPPVTEFRHDDEEAPHPDCSCGIYAYANLSDMARMFTLGSRYSMSYGYKNLGGGKPWGAVLGSGRIFAGTNKQGITYWRAEKAEVIALGVFAKEAITPMFMAHINARHRKEKQEKWERLADLYDIPLLGKDDLKIYAEFKGEYLQEIYDEASR